MRLQTIIDIGKSKQPLDYSDKIVLFGSCFVENIGQKLLQNKFQVDINPFGVLYNPLSIASAIDDLLHERSFHEADLFYYNGLYNSFSHHSQFSDENRDECLKRINTRIHSSSLYLREASRLIITFGSAYVYFTKKENNVVSNCHKIPDKEFVRRRISVEEIVTKWTQLIAQLREENPRLQILFTVSPIRHWKDGSHENLLSKSTLHLAIDRLIEINSNCNYFEAYEIMMDELRDYRYYAEDMIHPSNLAIEYIWKRFTETQLSKSAEKILKEWQSLKLSINHRPLHPKSETYRQFLLRNRRSVTEFTEKYPYFVLSKELEQIDEQLLMFE